jgi:hypothetical protein
MRGDVKAWLARARADAEARGLAGLVPLLETLAKSTAALRDADPVLAGPEGQARPEEAEGPTAAEGPDGPAEAN